MAWNPEANEVFLKALEAISRDERGAYLEQRCGSNVELRAQVQSLLEASERAGSFLETPVVQHANSELESQTCAGATPGETHTAADDSSLDFLAASEKPGSLGRLGHYEILESIGRGGMGVVLKAFDEQLHRNVAIKVMAPQLATNALARKRFVREARAAAAVRNEHVINIHAVEEANELPYLAMEYVAGVSLQERLDKSGPLQLTEILRIGMQTASGLAAAHAQGLIHRDIKPSNILLENGVERVKITDFGLARAVDDVSLTQSGVIAGTPQYMSPEQARGEAVDHRTDLFSLGSVMYAMCAGRAPFRATGSMAVLKRVCEDTPRAIREVNPETPDWLSAIIAKLQAKDPADRFQSAAEVSELLSRHLAHLQQPALAPTPASPSPLSPLGRGAGGEGRSRRRRRWAMAAAVFLVLLGGLSLTEATGVTNFRFVFLRIPTPEGTLIVEIDDPEVKVTIEGDGGLVINAPGLKEVRLKPGSYKVQAVKDGKPVRLDQELITITRDDKQAVKVSLEVASAPATAKQAGQPFVVLSGKGIAVHKYDTLADAVRGASDGDIIEVRGNGPFVSEPIKIRLPLTIRAGDGFRPIIKLSPEGLRAHAPLLAIERALVMDGLELQCMAQDWKQGEPWQYVLTASKDLHVANCRFLGRKIAACIYSDSPVAELRNCEFLCQEGIGGDAVQWLVHQSGQRLLIDNCLLTEAVGVDIANQLNATGAFVQLTRNTHRNTRYTAFGVAQEFYKTPSPGNLDQRVKLLRLQTSGNIFDASSAFRFQQGPPDKILPPRSAESHVAQTFGWDGERNLYAADGPLISFDTNGKGTVAPATPVKNLADWRRFWATAEANSIQGRARYQGGDLLAKLDASPEQLTPEDWRLRPDSAGYRAGKDGKDLGADIDLVGPGKGYERWKKTPDYQQWPKDTKQTKVDPPTGERQAFVLLGNKGEVVRKLDTLAEAVQSASDGDTIEVRGNGPFVTEPVNLGDRALVIRAAAGFRPVIELSPAGLQARAPVLATNARLVLEGLDLRAMPLVPYKEGERMQHVLDAQKALLHVANCRLLTRGHEVYSHANPSVCSFLNCEILCANGLGISTNLQPGSGLIIENCVQSSFGIGFPSRLDGKAPVTIRLSHTTCLEADQLFGVWLAFEKEPAPRLAGGIPKFVRMEVTGNVFHARRLMDLCQMSYGKIIPSQDAASFMKQALDWRGRQNLYAVSSDFLVEGSQGTVEETILVTAAKGLAGWKQFWKSAETDSLEGRVRYQGGDVLTKLRVAPETVTPEDFRLRPDSPGYRAGKDGKDLGADIDLVGPGKAYERWKMTPEYQQWLNETRHLKYSGAADQKSANPTVETPVDAKVHAELAGYDATLKVNPNDLATLLKRGNVLGRLKRFDDAVADFSKILEATPDRPEWAMVYIARAEVRQARDDWQGAIADYQAWIRVRPKDKLGAGRLAALHLFAPAPYRDAEKARLLLERIFQVMPTDHGYTTSLGIAYLRLDRLEEAVAILEKATSLRPGPDSYDQFALAIAYQRQGEKEKAQACYQKGMQTWRTTTQAAVGHTFALPILRAESEELLGVKRKE